MSIAILGISAYHHDSAAALIRDGKIVAAAQEERFTRKKFDADFPRRAARWCLIEAGARLGDVHSVVFSGDRPAERDQPASALEELLRGELRSLADDPKKTAELPPLLFNQHHRSHAASAFFAGPFQRAAVLCLDGGGARVTTSAWIGEGNRLTLLWEVHFPHSLGLLYSAFTHYCGFKVNSGEYKLMGLAPYGEPKYENLIREHLIDIKDDGTYRLGMPYFDFATGLAMTNGRFDQLFDGPPRAAEGPLTQRHMDLARSIQAVTEDVVLKLGRTVRRETGAENLCLAGDVALNCVANGRRLREGPFMDIWIQPSAGDAGGALGAALSVWNEFLGHQRQLSNGRDAMHGGYLGPHYNQAEVEAALADQGAVWSRLANEDLFAEVARRLADGRVVGWMQGRMEFGPRALGARSILGDPRRPEMQSLMNAKIKYRESFRPFAPAVLAERASDYFACRGSSPYMLLTVPMSEAIRLPATEDQQRLGGLDKLKATRSQIPAVTHVDYSARIQTVHADTNPRFWRLLQAFEVLTGCAVLINTSFNVRGEPIVCSPEDAYRCFMRTEMDDLCIGNCLLTKAEQPARPNDGCWRRDFAPD